MKSLLKILSEIKIVGGSINFPHIEFNSDVNSIEEMDNELNRIKTLIFEQYSRKREHAEIHKNKDREKIVNEKFDLWLENTKKRLKPIISKKWKQIFQSTPDIENLKINNNYIKNAKFSSVKSYSWEEGKDLLGPRSVKNIEKILNILSIPKDSTIIYKGTRWSRNIQSSKWAFYSIAGTHFTALYAKTNKNPILFVNTLRGSGFYWMLFVSSKYDPNGGNNSMTGFLKLTPEEWDKII